MITQPRIAAWAAAAGMVGAGWTHAVQAAAPAAPSAIGSEVVHSIAVSPAYRATGSVFVASSASGCSNDCAHLWATHDRGATWQRLEARNWQRGDPVVAVDGAGKEILFASGSAGLQRSDDGGRSWHDAGPAGAPTASPDFVHDGTVALAGGTGSDHLVGPQGVRTVPGSGGSFADTAFMYSPAFPTDGAGPPALLSAVDRHTGAPFVLRCNLQLACDSPVPLLAAQALPSTVSLVPSPSYAGDRTLFANATQALYKSSDGGHTFTAVSMGHPGALATATSAVAFDPAYNEHGGDRVAYAAVLQIYKDPTRFPDGGVYRTTDGGATWAPFGAPGPLDHGASAVAVAPDGRIFAGFLQAPGSTPGLVCWNGTLWAASCGTTSSRAGGGAACTGPTCAAVDGTGRTPAIAGAGGPAAAGSSAKPAPGRLSDAAPTGSSASGQGPVTLRTAVALVALGVCVLMLLVLFLFGRLGRRSSHQSGEEKP